MLKLSPDGGSPRFIALCALCCALFAGIARADSGLYVGLSAGGAAVNAEIGDVSIPGFPLGFDEDDTAYKLFGGYMLDLPFMFAAFEAAYVDFGSPEGELLNSSIRLDTTGVSMFGVAGIELGPIDLFGKLGGVIWDLEASGFQQRFSDNGFDFGIGAGISVGLGPLSIRGEYEYFDIANGDLSMLSVGAVYLFD